MIKPKFTVPSYVYSSIALLILGHAIWFNLLPFGFDEEYQLNFGNSKDTLSTSNVYIKDPQNVLSPTQSYGSETWRSFERDGTFFIDFNTPINLENETVEINIDYESQNKIFINDELIYDPAWGSKLVSQELGTQFIYGAEKFNLSSTNKSVQSEYETIEELLQNEFPQGVTVKDFAGNHKKIEKEMNDKYIKTINSVEYYDNWSSQSHTSNFSFRGPANLYGVFKDSIDLNIVKKDLNLYNGSDAVAVYIRDFNDTLVTNVTLEDNDGIKFRTTNESDWKQYNFSIPIEKEGIYKIEFAHKYPSEDPDFMIGDITFNSNKVMIDGSIVIWGPSKLYNAHEINNLQLRYWWSGYDQIVTFDDKSQLRLTPDLRSSWVNSTLENKSYFTLQKGKVIVDPSNDLSVFDNTVIDTNLEEKIIITKSEDIRLNNIILKDIKRLNITSNKGTKLYNLDIKLG